MREGRVDHEISKSPDQGIDPVRASTTLVPGKGHCRHLILQLWKLLAVPDTPLLIKSCDRLGARRFPLARTDSTERDRRIDLSDERGDEITSLVHLGNQPVRTISMKELNGSTGPGLWAGTANASVEDHFRPPVLRSTTPSHSGDDDPAFIGVRSA